MNIYLSSNVESQAIKDEMDKLARKISAIGYEVKTAKTTGQRPRELLEDADILLLSFYSPEISAGNAFEVGYFSALKNSSDKKRVLLGVKNCFMELQVNIFLQMTQGSFNYLAKNEKMLVEYLKVLMLNKRKITI